MKNEISLLDIMENIGELRGEVRSFSSQMRAIDSNIILACSQIQDLSTEVALQKNIIARHDRKISDLYQKVNVVENTGSINLNELKTEAKARWSTIKIIAAVFVGMITVAASVLGIIHTIQKIRGR